MKSLKWDCGNLLTGDLPPELGNLASLGVVNLGGTRLTGCIPSALREPLEKAHSDFGGLQYCPTHHRRHPHANAPR